MTIRNIAELAGVSASTVSKIMNNKDEHINANTRQRVLSIVREYNYKPYAGVKSGSCNFTLGLILPTSRADSNGVHSEALFRGLAVGAQQKGYVTLVLYSENSFESVRKCLSRLITAGVNGILWQPCAGAAYYNEFKKELAGSGISYLILSDRNDSHAVFPAYASLGTAACKHIIEKHHTKVACVIHDGSDKDRLFSQAVVHYAKVNGPQVKVDIVAIDKLTTDFLEKLSHYTAFICSDQGDALRLHHAFSSFNYNIPEYASLVCILNYPEELSTYPNLSGIRTDMKVLGIALSNALISLCEKRSVNLQELSEKIPFTFHTGSTLGNSRDIKERNILCIGTLNRDCTILTNKLPESGTSLLAIASYYSLGGKGANQAIGASRLGHKVILIGKTGDDPESLTLLRELQQEGVFTHAIAREPNCETGKAYIQLETNGDSTITVVAGANRFVTADYIRSNKKYFENASFCMITGELPVETIIEASRICSKYNVKTVFKPAAAAFLPDEIYSLVDFFVPNSYEATTLTQIKDDCRKQGDYFFEKGVRNLIITRGARGCYVRTGSDEEFYPACQMFSSVDNTGAADAFISAFTSYLAFGKTLSDAVHAAIIASGYAVSRIGSSPAMIDRLTLDNYMTIVKEKGPKSLFAGQSSQTIS